MSFGSTIKVYRERYGMNKKTFAARVGIHPDYLRQIEKGESNSPSAKIVAQMIAVLHLSPDEALSLLNETRNEIKT